MKTLTHLILTGAVMAWAGGTGAQEPAKAKPETAHAAHGEHVTFTPSDLKWSAANPALPPGAESVVLSGDPKQPGPFTMRAKLPDGYKVPPHWHPNDEHVTVISGTFGIATGEKFDLGQGKELGAGGYMLMPKGARHFAWAKGETVIQIHGIGPWGINYVNPDDDPRKKSGK